MTRPRRAVSAAAFPPLLAPLLAFLSACSGSTESPSTERPELGGPIAGLTSAERAAFERGRVVFERRFTPEDGLGPRYNAVSCESCHSAPVTGGSAQLYRNFYLGMVGVPGRQTPIPGLASAVVPAFGAGDDFSTTLGRTTLEPLEGTDLVLAQRNALPLFGVGLFEAISDATLLARADPNDEDGDGISGRFNTDAGTIGRFGVKAQSNNIELFTRAPLMNQMGITSDPFLGSEGLVSLGHRAPQVSSDPNRPTADLDSHADPEISRRDLGDLIAFTRFLAPPEPLTPTPETQLGAARFTALGCARCHVPELASSRGPVRAYTDLLLHDLGPELADGLAFGVPQSASLAPPTSAGEFRTQPLWGVALSAPFLHDGRAETLHDAIALHAGEAAAARDLYLSLSETERAELIAFLEHL
jgi:CxxC motif-containing protein (DUF1111 family)